MDVPEETGEEVKRVIKWIDVKPPENSLPAFYYGTKGRRDFKKYSYDTLTSVIFSLGLSSGVSFFCLLYFGVSDDELDKAYTAYYFWILGASLAGTLMAFEIKGELISYEKYAQEGNIGFAVFKLNYEISILVDLFDSLLYSCYILACCLAYHAPASLAWAIAGLFIASWYMYSYIAITSWYRSILSQLNTLVNTNLESGRLSIEIELLSATKKIAEKYRRIALIRIVYVLMMIMWSAFLTDAQMEEDQ